MNDVFDRAEEIREEVIGTDIIPVKAEELVNSPVKLV